MKKPRILVLQMCRMGDLLQTGPMLRGLRREHPAAEITLVVMDEFARTPLPGHLLDRLVVFPYRELAAGVNAPGADWTGQADRLREFLRELGEGPFDLAINLTQSDLSSLLMALVRAQDRRGPFVMPDRRRAVGGGWMQYFWANARSRALGCFNLVDLFTWTAGVGCDGDGLEFEVRDAEDAAMAHWLAARGLGGRRLIAVQLGASEESKRWPADRFAAMIDLLPAETGDVILVGTAAERPLAERFAAAVKRGVHDAVGATSLPELGALLRRCRLLVTNDTGTMHVATAVGTRVLDVSTGPVFVHETGPYGTGHVVVEPEIDCFPCAAGSQCHHFACRDRLTPRDAAAIARFALGEAPAPHVPGVRVLTSRRAASGRLEYWPVDSSQVGRDDVLRRLAATTWEETLGAPHPCRGAVGATEEAPRWDGSSAWTAPLVAALGELASTADRASSIAGRLAAAPPGRQRRLADEAHGCLERLLRLGETERACHPIVAFLLVEIDSVQATDLQSVARAHAAAYSGAAGRARRMANLVGHLPCSLAADERVAP